MNVAYVYMPIYLYTYKELEIIFCSWFTTVKHKWDPMRAKMGLNNLLIIDNLYKTSKMVSNNKQIFE